MGIWKLKLKFDPDAALKFTWIHGICYYTRMKVSNPAFKVIN